jgi:hypothetical protein
MVQNKRKTSKGEVWMDEECVLFQDYGKFLHGNIKDQNAGKDVYQ